MDTKSNMINQELTWINPMKYMKTNLLNPKRNKYNPNCQPSQKGLKLEKTDNDYLTDLIHQKSKEATELYRPEKFINRGLKPQQKDNNKSGK